MPITPKNSPVTGPRVLVLHGAVGKDSTPDNQDTLVQVRAVTRSLTRLGYRVKAQSLDLDLSPVLKRLNRPRPHLVFNLVESLGGRDALLGLGPLLLESQGLAYTGAPASALVATSDKREAKRLMAAADIPSPPSWQPGEPLPAAGPAWILKSAWEHASLGMTDDAVVTDVARMPELLAERSRRHGGHWFAEHFIPGREFNLSMLETQQGPVVLPPAEIRFKGFPPGKPHIVGYAAKWDQDSPEYKGTVRSFRFTAQDAPLLKDLRHLSERCWEVFGLRGYARVDFRVDTQGRPWVLEINANPCLSPDAGFAQAATRAKIQYDALIGMIVRAALEGEPLPAKTRARHTPRPRPRR